MFLNSGQKDFDPYHSAGKKERPQDIHSRKKFGNVE